MLLAVNGRDISTKSQKEASEAIGATGNAFTLTVRRSGVADVVAAAAAVEVVVVAAVVVVVVVAAPAAAALLVVVVDSFHRQYCV